MTDQAREPRMELLLDDHRGIYIPQGFAQEWAHAFTYPGKQAMYDEDVAFLARGPHPGLDDTIDYPDEQMEAWTRILDNAVGRESLPLMPGVAIPNSPMAGWRLDQGSCEDGCVRAYHPDDAELLFGGEE